MSAAARQRRRRARMRGELPPWQPKPKKRPPQFADDSPLLLGLASVDDMDLPEFVDGGARMATLKRGERQDRSIDLSTTLDQASALLNVAPRSLARARRPTKPIT